MEWEWFINSWSESAKFLISVSVEESALVLEFFVLKDVSLVLEFLEMEMLLILELKIVSLAFVVFELNQKD